MTPRSTSMSALLGRLVPGMGHLPPGLESAIDAGALHREHDDGCTLFEDGSPCGGLLVLEQGTVRVSLSSPSGRTLVLYRVRPGETCVLTLSCLLGHEPYPARGEVEGTALGVFVPAGLFDRLVWEAPAFREFVFTAFAARLRAALAVACAVAFERLDRRLAALLLDRAGRAAACDITVTHQQLADELGCSREAASRLLEDLEASGMVALGRGHLRVVDERALARLAQVTA